MLFLQNTKGKDVLVKDDYVYYCDGRNKTTDSWRCTNCGCPARVTTTKNKEVKRVTRDHNHPSNDYMIVDGVYVKMGNSC